MTNIALTNSLIKFSGRNEMTPEQEAHVQRIQMQFAAACYKKYRQGQAEHGGNLFDLTPKQLLDEAIAECIDQFTYLVTLRDKL